jgi:Na+/H+ antiporter NhaD/arsenite permease-like protein
MNLPAIAAIVIFLTCYVLLATEKVHKTKAVLAGAVLMILVGLVSQRTAFHGDEARHIEGIDWNTIMLLIGMMVIVNITRTTGAVEYLAIKSAKAVRGRPVPIIILFCVITAALSAFLDNVTTVIIIAPVVILIFERLKSDPVPALISIICASNIGGTATLIGDPPNIIIGSAARFSFMDFISIDAPPAIASTIALLIAVALVLRSKLSVSPEARERIMAFDESAAITDWQLLRRCLVVLGITLVGYVIHGRLGLEPATIALAGAALIMLLHTEGPDEALRAVEWSTIFFFIGLFIMVAGLVQNGVLEMLGTGFTTLTAGNTTTMTMVMLWASGLLCGVVNNIAYTTMMTPLIKSIAFSAHPSAATASFTQIYQAPNILPLWWALSLGACLGGNMTSVASAANVLVVGIANASGHPISFRRYLKYGVPIAFITLLISTLWLWFIFLR